MKYGFLIANSIAAVLLTVYMFFVIRRGLALADLKRRVKVPLIVLLLAVVFACSIDFRSFRFIIVVQLAIWFLIFDLLHLFVVVARKISKKPLTNKIFHILYRCGLVPVLLVTVFTLYGRCNMSQLHRTEYTLDAPSLSRDYKYLFLSDMHFDTIQEKSVFEDAIDTLNAEDLDFIILGGDICDEGTSAESAMEVFQQISRIKSRYGIFFIYGNHDRQIYSSEPFYTQEEFAAMIKANDITILQDSFVDINEEICLIGREDPSIDFLRTSEKRKSIPELLDTSAKDKPFVLLADHQPVRKEFKEFAQNLNGSSGMQISGHTHAGQIFPFGTFMALSGGFVYGEYEQPSNDGQVKLVVSSGVTGWGYPMRTEKHCEYVIVNLKGKR